MRLPVALIPVICTVLFIFGKPAFSQAEERSRSEIRKESRRLLKEATTRLDDRQFDESIVYLDSVLLVDDKNPDAYYYKSQALLEMGDTAGGAEVVSQGVKLAPRSSRLKILLGYIRINEGNYNEVIRLMDEILMFKPNESEALYLKGWSFVNKGDSSAALEMLEKAYTNIIDKDNK